MFKRGAATPWRPQTSLTGTVPEITMTKLIWATLDDYLPTGEGEPYVGRLAANNYFLRALLKYSRFDEFHFFLANPAHQRLFQTRHGQFLDEIGASDRVRIFGRLDLPAQLLQCDYTVFHQSDHTAYFNSLCHFRNQTARFPVTAFIHSLTYQRSMTKYQEMVIGGVTAGDALICSSRCGRQVIENYFKHIAEKINRDPPPLQLKVIPFGLDSDNLPSLDRYSSRKQLGLNEREVIGLYFGRLSDCDKMDLLPLLQAFKQIHNGADPWRIILAGAVDSEDYLKILQLWTQALGISDRVTFMTNLPEKYKLILYSACDFFISLSDNPQETFGMTLLEAMAFHLPLIVSDFDGYKEIVTDDIGKRITTTWTDLDSFFMLSPFMDEATYHRYLAQSISVDVRQLSEVLRFFFSNPSHLLEMGKAAFNRYLQYYDYKVIVSQLDELWIQLSREFSAVGNKPLPDPLAVNLTRCFSTYVTNTLDLDANIRLADFGRLFMGPDAQYPLLPEMSALIDRSEVKELLKLSANGIKVGEAFRDMKGEPWRKKYLLLWMLKHGLICVESAGSPGS
jgi:glycosyltransferase involved in cell wall biosynthesis